MAPPVISTKFLVKRFGQVVAVSDLTMDINAGEIFGFLGANGAGKTTTMRMLCGLTKPTRGKGTIQGLNIWKDRFRIRALFGYVPQRFSLYGDLTVAENLVFFGSAYGVSHLQLRKGMQRWMKELDLIKVRQVRAGSLSGGFKQLLSIGCALLHSPSLLFLDEPTAGLDPVHRQQIWDLLYELSQLGTTIFVTTHYMDEVERCTKVGFIDGGELLAFGSPRELKLSLNGKIVELEVEPLMPAMEKLRELPGVQAVDLRSGKLRVHSVDARGLLQQLEKAWPFEGIRYLGSSWVEPDMEDVFKAYSYRLYDLAETG